MIRLRGSVDNAPLFTTVTWALMGSTSYQVACFQHIFPGWHREEKYEWVIQVMQKTAKLVQTIKKEPQAIEFRRKYIPKPNGKMRGLGIPAPHWRVFLHGFNAILTIWFLRHQHPSQHGFWPGRGTTTAWKEIHAKVIPSDNIYEFDFERFFDTINLKYLQQLLRVNHFPPALLKTVDVLNRSMPAKEEYLDMDWESEDDKIRDYIYLATGIWYPKMPPLLRKMGKWFLERAIRKDPRKGKWEYYRGVPPGSPLSPLLSSIVLHGNLLDGTNNVVQYADDGLIYGHTNPEEILANIPARSGIKVNSEKSQWIKRDGVWLTSLKFLGIRFIPKGLLTKSMLETQMRQDGVLESATREGNPVTFDKYDMIEEAYSYDIQVAGTCSPSKPKLKNGQTWKEWFETHYMGYVTSQLYAPTSEGMKKVQNFEYSFAPGSWAALEDARGLEKAIVNGTPEVTLDIFNSSTFACEALYQKLIHEANKTKGTNLRC